LNEGLDLLDILAREAPTLDRTTLASAPRPSTDRRLDLIERAVTRLFEQ